MTSLDSKKLDETLISIRRQCDMFINSTKLLESSRESALAHTSLQRAKMWLGKCLSATGNATPYPESENPKNNVIEPQAEHGEEDLRDRWLAMGTDMNNPVSRIKAFRACLQNEIDRVQAIWDDDLTTSMEMIFTMYFINFFSALMEAKMWLGWELDQIRKSSQTKTGEVTQPIVPDSKA